MIRNSIHIPVLLNEVIKLLDPKPREFLIDGTVGGGGHSVEILKKILPGGKLLGIDRDKNSLEIAKQKISAEIKNNFILIPGNYADLPEILKKENLEKADGLLIDLGMSSDQLEKSGRGFSFLKDEPLLMTYDLETKPAKDVLKELSEKELAKIIKDFSQERFAEKIAKAIKQQEKIKPIETTKELAAVIQKAVPKWYERGRINPATRTFMALRIYVNQELENLEKLLKNLDKILKIGGRVAVISFHSLEDRIIKNYFRDLSKVGKIKILNKKPIRPTEEEIKNNPRARSAKLRAAVII